MSIFMCRQDVSESVFFLENCKFSLKWDHAHYQMQAQMKFCLAAYGDFIVWQEEELIVEQLPINELFFTNVMQKATRYFTHGVLPHLLEKMVSKVTCS